MLPTGPSGHSAGPDASGYPPQPAPVGIPGAGVPYSPSGSHTYGMVNPQGAPGVPEGHSEEEPAAGTGKKKSKGGGGIWKKRPSSGAGGGAKLAPNRAGILVARYVILGSLGVFSLAGIAGILGGGGGVDPAVEAPRLKPFISPASAQVASSMAERFLGVYLEARPDGAVDRREMLSVFAPSLEDVQWTTSTEARQEVLAGPYVAKEPVLLDPALTASQLSGEVGDVGVDVWSVSATALIRPGKAEPRWVNVTVPVSVDRATGYAEVTGIPAFLPPPPLAELVGPRMYGRPDQKLSVEFSEILTGFFPDWGRSDTTRLSRWLSPTATDKAQLGLGGIAEVEKIGVAEAYSFDAAGPAYALVTVQWKTGPNTIYPQQYLMTFVQVDGGRWAIDDISSVGFTSQ